MNIVSSNDEQKALVIFREAWFRLAQVAKRAYNWLKQIARALSVRRRNNTMSIKGYVLYRDRQIKQIEKLSKKPGFMLFAKELWWFLRNRRILS